MRLFLTLSVPSAFLLLQKTNLITSDGFEELQFESWIIPFQRKLELKCTHET